MPDTNPESHGAQVPSDREPVGDVLDRFDDKKPLLEALCEKTKEVIAECLEDANIRYQSVQARVKSKDKLKQKYLDESKDYKRLDDITDQAALRIITYYEDEIDSAAAVIRREFSVDATRSVDKRETEPDRFGYYALNFVCSHLDRRTSSVEYKKLAGISFEVQVTSILRHAWSEIEHDWYDLKDAYPGAIKRRFYRLAALLEIVESEFLDLRKSKASYRQSVAVQVEAGVPDVPLTQVSLKTVVQTDPAIRRADEALAKLLGYVLSDPTENIMEMRFKQLKEAGITSIKDLTAAVATYEHAILEYVSEMLGIWNVQKTSGMRLERGTAVAHLSMMLLSRRSDEEIFSSLNALGIPLQSYLGKQIEVARRILAKH